MQKWHDISFNGNGNANGLNVTQGTAGQRPTWRQSIATTNNMPVVRYDGSDDNLSTASLTESTLFATNEISVFAVIMQDGAKSHSISFGWGPDTNNMVNAQTTWGNDINFVMGDTGGGGFMGQNQPAGWDDNYHTLEFYRLLGAGEITVDGSSISFNSSEFSDDLDNSVSSSLYVGSARGGFNDFQGDIAELIIYRKALTTDERNRVTCYLSNKYNLTVSTSCD